MFQQPAVVLPTGRLVGPALDLTASPDHRESVERSDQALRQVSNPAFRDGAEHIVYGGRRHGKTTVAVKWLLDAPAGTKRVLVVENDATAQNLKANHGLKRNDDRIVSYRSLTKKRAQPGTQYGVDGVATILADLLGLREMPHLLTIEQAAPWQA